MLKAIRSTIGASFIGLCTVFSGTSLAQNTYPTRPITIIVPFAPGGNLDVTARIVGAELSKILGQPVAVDNKAGAGGAIGHQALARANPDGYTLLTTANGSFAVTPRLQQGKRPFEAKEFAPIGMIGITPLVLEVHGTEKFKNFKEFLSYAKANPGQITVGHSGNGTTNHVAILQLEEAAGIKLNIVPYKGSGPALSDLLGGQIDAVVDQLPSSMSYLKSGKLSPLAVTTTQRAPDLPEVPTFVESGLKNFNVSTASGLLAPANTPAMVIEQLNKALNLALQNKDVAGRLISLGSAPTPMSSKEFGEFLMNEDAKAEALVKRGVLVAE